MNASEIDEDDEFEDDIPKCFTAFLVISAIFTLQVATPIFFFTHTEPFRRNVESLNESQLNSSTFFGPAPDIELSPSNAPLSSHFLPSPTHSTSQCNSFSPTPSQTPPPLLRVCASCPEVDDGGSCLLEDVTPPRMRRRVGGGFDKCSEKTYRHPYTAVHKMRNTTAPWVSEDAFRELGDWIVDWMGNCPFAPENVRCGDIVFVKTDNINSFLRGDHLKITQPYVLLSHASDITVTSDFARDALSGANRHFLEHWFALNIVGNSIPSWVSWIPLGLQGPGWWPGEWYPNVPSSSAFSVPILRQKLVSFLNGSLAREFHVLVAFSSASNPTEREAAAQAASALGFQKKDVSKENWALTVQQHLFVIAPAGNGVDTHRIWESILNGAIPIVRSHVYDSWLSCLPFVRLDNWSDLSESLLITSASDLLRAFEQGSFDFRRTMLPFHAGRIARAAARATAKCDRGSQIAADLARTLDAEKS